VIHFTGCVRVSIDMKREGQKPPRGLLLLLLAYILVRVVGLLGLLHLLGHLLLRAVGHLLADIDESPLQLLGGAHNVGGVVRRGLGTHLVDESHPRDLVTDWVDDEPGGLGFIPDNPGLDRELGNVHGTQANQVTWGEGGGVTPGGKHHVVLCGTRRHLEEGNRENERKK